MIDPRTVFVTREIKPRSQQAVERAVWKCMQRAGAAEGDIGGIGTSLLKPNFIHERHPRDPDGWQYTLTHPGVIRAVADWIVQTADRSVDVVLADAPQTDACFETIRSLLGLDELARHYRSQGLDFELLDLRREEWISRDGVIVERRKLPGDPRGYIAFDLGEYSEFAGHSGAGRYYGADYNEGEVNRHHTGGRHQYLVSRTAMEADVLPRSRRRCPQKLQTTKNGSLDISPP